MVCNDVKYVYQPLLRPDGWFVEMDLAESNGGLIVNRRECGSVAAGAAWPSVCGETLCCLA